MDSLRVRDPRVTRWSARGLREALAPERSGGVTDAGAPSGGRQAQRRSN